MSYYDFFITKTKTKNPKKDFVLRETEREREYFMYGLMDIKEYEQSVLLSL